MALARKQKRLVAVRYARRSIKAKGRRVTSPETQLTECADHVEAQGYDLYPEVYVDPDVSAYRRADGKLKNRPGWTAMAEAIASGGIDVVVCWDLNRLTRDVEVAIEFAKLCRRYGVDVEDTRGVRYRLSTPTGYSDFLAVAAASQRDSAAKSEVVTRELGTAAREGSPAGGPAGFGYRRINRSADAEPSFTLVKEEAFLLRRAVTTVMEGGSLRDAAKIVRPLWPLVQPKSIRKTLLSPRIAGLRRLVDEDGVEEFFPAQWPAIIPPKTWHRLVALLTDEGRRNVGRPAEYLLTGGTVETVCGGRLQARAQGAGHRKQYRCGKDFCCSRDREVLEEFVTALVFKAVDGGALARFSAAVAAGDGQAERIAARRKELREKNKRVIDMGEDGLISNAEVAKRLAKNNAELDRLVLPTRQGRQIPEEGEFPQWWAAATLDAKRWLITSLFRIVVGPTDERSSRWHRPIDPIDVERLI